MPNNPSLNPNGSPFVIWTPEHGKNGKVIFIANGNSREELFINTDEPDPDGWKPVSDSRGLRIINTPMDSAAKGQPKHLITNGGNIGCQGSCYNYFTDGVLDIPTYSVS
ncbi:hypothetical protein F52700_2315 [Fusarium sp. NRRL 52700]|nr:hypothetical protein F52700_2315 [Fusarium sp. NRRL 52700]